MPSKMSDDEFIKSIGGTPFAEEKEKPPPEEEGLATDVTHFKEGTIQGLLNVPESLGQIAEAGVRQVSPGFKMPLHDWARDYRKRVESTGPGIAGEVAGSVLPSLIPGIGAYTDLSMLARSAPTIARAGMGAAQGLISRPVSGNNAGDNEYFTQGAAGAALGAIGGQNLARYIPPHVGRWMYNLPHAIKHAIGVALIRSAGRVPPRVGATAAGAVTPEPNQPQSPPLRFTVPGNPQ